MDNVYVLKFGGNAISGQATLERFCKEIKMLIDQGAKIVLIHGGGPEINEALENKGIVPKKVCGFRLTDDATMEVVEDTLRSINVNVVNTMKKAGINALGIPGYFLTEGKKKDPVKVVEDGKEILVDLILAGDVVSTDCEAVEDLLASGITPVVYPVGADKNGKHLNINADTMAAGIAAGIKCKEMIQITDVPGILLDIKDPTSLQSQLSLKEVDELIEKGIINGGMIPKVEACRNALDAGVGKVRMVNGKDEHSIVSDIMTAEKHGTVITR